MGALLFLVGLLEVVAGAGETATGEFLILLAWAMFAIDLVVRWILDSDSRTFPRRHWLEFIAVTIPVFRVGMVAYVFVRLARRRGRLVQKVQVYAAYLTVLVVIFGALLVLSFERGYADSNIKTYGEAIWWAFVTVTTVGYGDYVPVSPQGRAIAVLMLANGVVLISVVTAVIAAKFVQDPDRDERAVTLDQLDERLARIEEAIATLRAEGGSLPDDAGRASDDGMPAD
jgi:voltage-gated potassium channel